LKSIGEAFFGNSIINLQRVDYTVAGKRRWTTTHNFSLNIKEPF